MPARIRRKAYILNREKKKAPEERSPSGRIGIIKATLIAAGSFTVMAGATIAPALPRIKEVFEDIPDSDLLVPLVLTAPALFIALGASPVGRIIDRFGRRRLLLSSILLYGIAGTSGLYLNDLYLLLLGRIFLGLAVAGIMTTTTTLIADYFRGAERHALMGLQSSFMAFGGVFFLIGGGILADLNWRAPFAIYASAFLLFPLAWLFLPEPVQSQANRPESRTSEKARADMVTVRLLYGLAFFSMIIFYLIPVHIPAHLKEMGIKQNLLSGLALGSMTLCSGLVAINYRRIKEKLSHENIYLIVFSFWGAGYTVITLATSYLQVVAGLALSGLGMGMLMPNTNVMLVGLVPDEQRGRMVGRLTSSFFIGQFLSPLPFRSVEHDFGLSAVFGAAAATLAIFIFLFLIYRLSIHYRNPREGSIGQE